MKSESATDLVRFVPDQGEPGEHVIRRSVGRLILGRDP